LRCRTNELLADIEEAMRDVVDPELGINVVDLGLVYGVNLEEGGGGHRRADRHDADVAGLPADRRSSKTSRATRLIGAGLVDELRINWVWNPPWGPGQRSPTTAATNYALWASLSEL